MSDPSPQAAPTDRPRRGPRWLGRRIGQVLYYALVGAIAVAVTVQITDQVFFADAPDAPPPFATCAAGLTQLYEAVQRGREAAEQSEPEEDEDASLLRYRAAVDPLWRYRDTVSRLCQDDPDGRRLLDALERLRYSEEHSVRHQATELTALRQRVRRLMAQRTEPQPQPPR